MARRKTTTPAADGEDTAPADVEPVEDTAPADVEAGGTGAPTVAARPPAPARGARPRWHTPTPHGWVPERGGR